ncbi:replication initiation protein RepC [Sinorhizobium medicae]|uniref:plasmid replication protein RepC n=1 Tax=Sinorhizobium medicae TaxID=110321 RepID=UPI000FDA46B2|nr:plasmid replication protein RepC [Sinorhizobium medicae]MBO1945329.1 replication initiation protein RepC [Sinorhizobium medicae]MDX0867340.1 replication initiation protein RepC [Sinorhizobium medicae]MDX1009497.1 replication initiation protein RepC [Sinorhizobium medicae]RVJ34413.1 replication initiation protein RepC [Sinorhizobium medicae]
MESGSVTTPFGRRSMTLAMLAGQFISREIEPGKSVEKWKLFRSLCAAKRHLGISDRALAVLNALLSFYPENTLSEETGLIVFPSNLQLSLRAHGMAEATLRRHLAALVDAGLVARKDSPNGKRYARKTRDGAIGTAFGFSLAPLLARSTEIEQLAAKAEADRLELQRLRERLTLCRRDIAKLIDVVVEGELPSDWATVQEHFRTLVQSIPRAPGIDDLTPLVAALEILREQVANRLQIRAKPQELSGNPDQTERHIQESKPESIIELEAGSGNEPSKHQPIAPASEANRIFPLGLVLKACPEIVNYGPDGTVRSWRDLMIAAVTVRSMLGVYPSAYQEACAVMGTENAAAAMACILERAGHINSAGGYLRDLTAKAKQGKFSLGPMLVALLRANGFDVRSAS